jgi:hypothetical protein
MVLPIADLSFNFDTSFERIAHHAVYQPKPDD